MSEAMIIVRRIIVRSSVIATAAWVLVALAGCATTRSNTLTAAGRLQQSADAFDSDTRGEFPDSAAFADQAHYFRQTVDQAGDREVISVYEELWRRYHALRDEVNHSDSREARVALKPVTRAFRTVVTDMQGFADADPALLARGGFQFDPYYDP
jgi:hypothetical protein